MATGIYIVAYVLVIFVGLVGNLLVIQVIFRVPRMRTVTNLFIANLCVADLLVITFCMPATLMSNLFVRKYIILIDFLFFRIMKFMMWYKFFGLLLIIDKTWWESLSSIFIYFLANRFKTRIVPFCIQCQREQKKVDRSIIMRIFHSVDWILTKTIRVTKNIIRWKIYNKLIYARICQIKKKAQRRNNLWPTRKDFK